MASRWLSCGIEMLCGWVRGPLGALAGKLASSALVMAQFEMQNMSVGHSEKISFEKTLIL